FMRRKDDGGKWKKFLVYFIGFVMIASVFGVIFWGGDSTVRMKYKDLKFVNKGNSWSTTINGKEALFSYLPPDAEDIAVNEDIISRLKNSIEIDVTSDFNDTFAESIALAQYQMGITLDDFNVFVRNGFSDEQANFEVITCEDSTDFVPVVYFQSSNETKVYLEDKCIIAEAANDADVLRIKDRLVYGLLGVIG
ncbi:hypothetical protein KY347_04230, partial [Candidatus Woesearchaeota archaeon]|nr:hypothetical protein [Candidatus Woesearchaeota archaeon]